MAEIMGGIKRLINKNNPNPDLLRERLQEQRDREQKAEGEERKKLRLSNLQRVIIKLCVNNPPRYDATLDQILDAYFGKNTPATPARKIAIWRSVRNLRKKGFVQLTPHQVKRIELTPIAQKIAKEEAEK